MKIKKIFFFSLIMIVITPCLYAAPVLSAPKDPAASAESCRQIAVKLDWLSRYQDRPACTKNLDGLQAYIACQHILNKRYNDAEEILTIVLYQINFSIETQCYGQDDMKALASSLDELINTL